MPWTYRPPLTHVLSHLWCAYSPGWLADIQQLGNVIGRFLGNVIGRLIGRSCTFYLYHRARIYIIGRHIYTRYLKLKNVGLYSLPDI